MKGPKGLKPINTGLPKFRAFTIEENGIAPSLITSVGISLPFIPTPNQQPHPIHSSLALWDTGATASAISSAFASKLGLKPIDKDTVHHAGGSSPVNIYFVNFYLPNNFVIPGHRVMECNLTHNKFEVIIGMDIIQFGDFSLSHVGGKTKFSFRMPSLGCLDFLKDKHGGQLENIPQLT